MKFESVSIPSLEKELQKKIEQFNTFVDNLEEGTVDKNILIEMITPLKSLYDTVLTIKSAYNFEQFLNYDKMSFILSISEVDSVFFNNIQLISAKIKLPINELMNNLMKVFVDNSGNKSSDDYFGQLSLYDVKKIINKEKLPIFITNKDFLEVLPSDLLEDDVIYHFKNIEILIFKEITTQEFQNSIASISDCKTVFIPNNISKLVIYSKLKNITSVKLYDSLNDVYDAIFVFI